MHPQRRKRLLTAGAVAAVLLAVPTAVRADADKCASDASPAKCYRLEADAIRETRPAEAAQLYLKSYKLEPKIDPLAGYGFSLSLDKQYVAAAEVLEKAVEEYDKVRQKLEKDNTDAQTLFQVIHRIEFVKEEINKLVPKIGKVQLKGGLPPGVTVVRKGGDATMRGADTTLLFVNANSDVLVFTYPSGRSADVEVAVPAGTISQLDVPAEPPLPPPPPPPPPPWTDKSAPYTTKGYVFTAIGGAIALGGLGYVVVADSPSAGLTTGLVAGGLAVVGVGGYYFWKASKVRAANPRPSDDTKPGEPPTKKPSDEEEEDTEAALFPMITGQAVGAMISGTF